jgi:FkbM family methyltransferase
LSREEIRAFAISFSQFGEDLSITRWVDELKIDKGTYLDIGAFHPVLWSNTLLLHKRGWSGVNIDMNPDKIHYFQTLRPNDDNLCCAISSSATKYIIKNKGSATERLKLFSEEQENQELNTITSKTLDDALQGTSLEKRTIDYVNIDCEGHDFEVLKQLDLFKYNVSIITIEALEQPVQDSIINYMVSKGYCLREKIHWTLLFTKDSDAIKLTRLVAPNM